MTSALTILWQWVSTFLWRQLKITNAAAIKQTSGILSVLRTLINWGTEGHSLFGHLAYPTNLK